MDTAPEIEGIEWLNCKPTLLSDLKDQVVVLVFWSFGCEAALERIRQMQEISNGFNDLVTVVGIHTPRFIYEQDINGIKQAINQWHIQIPILHDPEYISWNRYKPSSWPATIIISPDGKEHSRQMKVNDVIPILDSIQELIPNALPKEKIDLTSSERIDSILGSPTKLSANKEGILAVADPYKQIVHILEISPDATSARLVAGIENVEYPAALLIKDDYIYVTDIYDGSLTRYEINTGESDVISNDLTCPTGILSNADGNFIISDSSSHTISQISFDQTEKKYKSETIAGTGELGCTDGTKGTAKLAEPAGMDRTIGGIIFCDSASSKLRILSDSGKVTTLTGSNNFNWGFQDGSTREALFQRPSDVCVDSDQSILIADTGNNQIRVLKNRNVTSLKVADLNRPEGICRLPGGEIAIADTGNQRIVVLSGTRKTAWELDIN